MYQCYDADKTSECCAICSAQFVQNTGRYIYNTDAFCTDCWGQHGFDIRLNREINLKNRNVQYY